MKSHFFAGLLIERCLMDTTRAVCIREVQKSIKESVKLLLEDKIKAFGVTSEFEITESEIRHKRNGSMIIFRGMKDYTADSIKSLEGFDIAWWEEAQTASERSLRLLRPTIIRKDTAEMWFSWNPEDEDRPIEKLLRSESALKEAVVVHSSYKENPYLSEDTLKEIEQDRLRDIDEYAHVYLGQFRRVLDGAVYAKEIRAAYESDRVCNVMPIAGKLVDTFWDLGKRDHTSIWFAQIEMGEYRIVDFYQNRGFKLDHYTEVVRSRGYPIGKIWLPHDADQDRLTGKTIAQSMRDLMPNIPVQVIERMAKKSIGIEAVRRIFPNCFFNADKTKVGLKALGAFKYDVDPDTGSYSTNPLHDENSDAADAFAQLALSLAEKKVVKHVAPGKFTTTSYARNN